MTETVTQWGAEGHGAGVRSSGEASLMDPAQRGAVSLTEQARARAREQVQQRSGDLGARASATAEDLFGVSAYLRSQGRTGPAHLAEQAARQVASLGDYLQRTSGETLLRDVEDLGRRRPWVAVAGGIASGLAASRLLKASSRERYGAGAAGSRPLKTASAGTAGSGYRPQPAPASAWYDDSASTLPRAGERDV